MIKSRPSRKSVLLKLMFFSNKLTVAFSVLNHISLLLRFLQGPFPSNNSKQDGYDGASPVDSFPMQNKYGDWPVLSFQFRAFFFFKTVY